MFTRRMAALVLALLLVACEGESDPGTSGPSPRVPVRTPDSSPSDAPGPVIALVGTMSGREGWRGEDAFEGADVAIQSLNQDKDEDRLPFQLVTLDDEGRPELATQLVEEIAADPRVVGIVYAGPPSGLAPAAPTLARVGVPAIICYGDLYSAKALRSYLFQMSPPLLWQARRHAAYISRDRRYRRVGFLSQNSMDGDTAADVVPDALRDRGIRDLHVARFEAGAEWGPLLERMERRRVEALMIHGGPTVLPDLVAALRERGAVYRNTAAARTVSAPRRIRRRERRTGDRRPWRPQILAFDQAIRVTSADLPPGTVASDSYSRGVHYLPLPSLKRFRDDFRDWWDAEPLGWERRAFDAVSALGWAAGRTARDADVARTLETLEGRRFGGLDVRFGPDDHTAAEEQSMGLWVVPSPERRVRERDRLPDGLPWVMLGRGFSTNGQRTDIFPKDWDLLFRDPPPKNGPGPRIGTGRFGVTTPRRDPVH